MEQRIAELEAQIAWLRTSLLDVATALAGQLKPPPAESASMAEQFHAEMSTEEERASKTIASVESGYQVVMKVFTFDTEKQARDFSDVFTDAFCDLPEAESYAAITTIEKCGDEERASPLVIQRLPGSPQQQLHILSRDEVDAIKARRMKFTGQPITDELKQLFSLGGTPTAILLHRDGAIEVQYADKRINYVPVVQP